MKRGGESLLVVAAVAAVVALATVIASDRPAERILIARATRQYVAGSGCCALARVAIVEVRESATDPAYAAADLDGWDRSGQYVGRATAVLQRTHGTWRVLELGTSGLGCRLPSARVRADLGVGCDTGPP